MVIFSYIYIYMCELCNLFISLCNRCLAGLSLVYIALIVHNTG